MTSAGKKNYIVFFSDKNIVLSHPPAINFIEYLRVNTVIFMNKDNDPIRENAIS